VDSVVDFAKRKNEPIALRRPVNLLGLIELAKFAGDAEVAFALGDARGLGVLEELEGGLEGAEERCSMSVQLRMALDSKLPVSKASSVAAAS